MIKVLIADDEPLVRAGIKTVLPWNMYGFDVIAEAADGKEAYEKILKLQTRYSESPSSKCREWTE